MKMRIAYLCMLCGVLVLAGCGGASSSRVNDLEDRVNTAEAEVDRLTALAAMLEVAKTEAETAKTTAEAAQATAEAARIRAELRATTAESERDDAVRRATTAESERDDAVRRATTAESERDDAETRATTAESERDAAVADRDAEEQRRLQAQRELEEAEQANAKAKAQALLAGIPTEVGTDSKGGITATPSYGEPSRVTTTETPTFRFDARNTRTGSLMGWSKTEFSGRDGTNSDMAEIFSNIERPNPTDFKDHPFGSDTIFDDDDRTNYGTDGGLTLVTATHGSLVRSGSFPRTSGPAEDYTLVDRGPDDDTNINDMAHEDYRLRPRDQDRHPDRWSIELSGTLQGASGKFRCGGTDSAADCEIQQTGPGNFRFVGTWKFFPSGPTAKVQVPDAEYMWFGWWTRETVATGTFQVFANYGGTNAPTDFSGATGTATYRGPAVGQYAVHDDVGDGSSSGLFTATAELEADFDSDTVAGSITDFSNDSSWSVTLQSKAVAATTEGTVSWSVGDDTRDMGEWEATFYSNFEGGAADTNAQPSGIAGTFTAQHGTFKRMIGAFGAERN